MSYSKSLVLVAFIGLFGLIAGPLPAAAGVGRWTHAGPGGGEVRALAIDPSDPLTLHAAASFGGVYTSRNGGASWTWGAGRNIWAVAVDPAHPATLYAGGPGEFLRSTDRGRSWQRLDPRTPPFTFEALAVAPGEPSIVYTVDGSQLFASADRGETWSPVFAESLAFHSLAVDPFDPDTIYLAGLAGIFRSSDAGAFWTRVHPEIPGLLVLAADPRRPGRLYLLADRDVYRSDDGGTSWFLAGHIPGLLIGRALAVDPGAPGTVWAAGEHGMFVSRDAGETWRAAGEGLPKNDNFGINALAIGPGGTIYAGTSGGVARTFNGGRRWWLLQQPGLSAESILMVALDPGDAGAVYVTLSPDRRSFRSHDSGRTWEPFARTLDGGGPSDVVPDSNMLWAGNPSGVWVSFDDGATWLRRDRAESVHLAFAGPNILSAGTCGLRFGARHGRAWRQVLPCVLPGPEETVLSVAELLVDPRDPSRVYALTVETFGLHGSSYRLMGSRDSGRSWKLIREGASAAALGSDGRLYTYDALDGMIRRSSDGGQTWLVVQEGLPQGRQLAVDAGDSSILYLSTRELGVIRSLDGGVTWEPMNRGLARMGRLDIGFLRVHPEAPGLLYAVPTIGGLFQIALDGPQR